MSDLKAFSITTRRPSWRFNKNKTKLGNNSTKSRVLIHFKIWYYFFNYQIFNFNSKSKINRFAFVFVTELKSQKTITRIYSCSIFKPFVLKLTFKLKLRNFIIKIIIVRVRFRRVASHRDVFFSLLFKLISCRPTFHKLILFFSFVSAFILLGLGALQFRSKILTASVINFQFIKLWQTIIVLQIVFY